MTKQLNDTSRVLGRHERGATAVAVNPQSSCVASGGTDGTIRIWSVAEGKMIAELHGHGFGYVESLAFSPDGIQLVSGGNDATVRIWDVEGGRQLFVRSEHDAVVKQVAYSHDGQIIASAGLDTVIRLWNPLTGEPLGKLEGHYERVRCLAFHPTEPTLVSGSFDNTIRVWNWQTGQPEPRFAGGVLPTPEMVGSARFLTFDSTGDRLAVVTFDAEIREFQFGRENAGEEIRRLREVSSARCMIWPKDSPLTLGFWNAEIRLISSNDPSRPFDRLVGHSKPLWGLAASTDGSFLVSASEDGDVRLWPDFKYRSKISRRKPQDQFSAKPSHNYSTQFCDGNLLVDFQQDELALFRLSDRERVRSFPKLNNENFAISPSGRTLLLGRLDGEIRCLRVEDGQTLWTRKLPPLITVGEPGKYLAIDQTEVHGFVVCDTYVYVLSLKDSTIVGRWGILEMFVN